MMVICLNGSINSGKSTIGKALATLLPDAVFADGDDHDAPAGATLSQRVAHALERLERLVRECRSAFLVLAYPLRDEDYARLRQAAAARGAALFAATLAPPLAVALSNRGARDLSDWERERIRAMYDEGYGARAFSDVILSECAPPEIMVRRLADLVQRNNASR